MLRILQVLHQGPDTWNVSTAFEDLFALPDELAADLLSFLPKFNHALLDLSRFDPATQETDPQLRIVLHLMKLARERQLLAYFRWLAETRSLFPKLTHGYLWPISTSGWALAQGADFSSDRKIKL